MHYTAFTNTSTFPQIRGGQNATLKYMLPSVYVIAVYATFRKTCNVQMWDLQRVARGPEAFCIRIHLGNE